MYSETAASRAPTTAAEARCADLSFRLSVYEAGHALTARALGLKVVSVQMLPRPPVLISDKTFTGKWDSFIEMLEIRIIELFGGQIAEEHTCDSNTCFGGDVARIDELCRLVAGLSEEKDAETIWFDLEDVAIKIFSDDAYRTAILPIADYLYQRVQNGSEVIDGVDIETEMDKYVPHPPEDKKWMSKVFSFGRKKA
ncbi:MAG: hypothetical protein Q9M48_09280 [Rhodobacterales bacterium]|nr:hypothetical protein [Rhodobacterales bacterium]